MRRRRRGATSRCWSTSMKRSVRELVRSWITRRLDRVGYVGEVNRMGDDRAKAEEIRRRRRLDELSRIIADEEARLAELEKAEKKKKASSVDFGF